MMLARQRVFVGREAELALWRDALQTQSCPFAVLWFVGPGGVGKSTLLLRLADLARDEGIEPVVVDVRSLVGSPTTLLERLAGRASATVDDVAAALDGPVRRVLLLDTAEDLGELEDWLRDVLLPTLPASVLIAVAGRRPPGPGWRIDPAWSDLLRVVALRNLSPDDSRRLLEARGVDWRAQPRLLAETHGHPLALALVADVVRQDPSAASIDLRAHPDVVTTLLTRFVHDAPDDDHRRALHIAAHVRATNEEVLRHGLGRDDARETFEWLGRQSFAVPHPEGLYLHDLAAQAIDADHRRRDPGGYGNMHARLREPIIERLRTNVGAEQYRAAMDLSWLHRFSSVMGSVIDWDGARSLAPAGSTDADIPNVVEATRRFQGDAAAELIGEWIRRQPRDFAIVWASPTHALGYVASLVVTGREADDPLVRADPRMAVLIDAARARRPLRPDDRLELCLWLSYETHVDPSAMASQLSIANVRSWFGTPGLDWGGMAIPARLDTWGPMMAYLDHHPIGEVAVGETSYAMFLHDWRTVTPTAFLDMMGSREITSEASDAALAPPREVLAMSHEAFVAAAKQALRELSIDDALVANPLSRCRVALEAPGTEGIGVRRAVQWAAHALTRSGKDEVLHAALKLTYLDPVRTQEEAAELLGLPFSTFRRHLTQAVERVIAWLWERDLHGYGPVDTGEVS